MWFSSNVDTSTRSKFEISTTALKRFYEYNEEYFDAALDAVVTGCVKEFSFTEDDMKFVGVVTSFDGIESFEAQIYVTEDFAIESASCSCPIEICHHIGALALHSGFKTPLFSYLPQKRTVDNASSTNGNGDVDNNEMEFVGIKMENCDGGIVDTNDTDADRNPNPIKLRKSRPKLVTTYHSCRLCDKLFTDSHQLQIHETKEHNIACDRVKITAYICRICRKMFIDSFQLHVHQRKEHLVSVDPLPVSSASSE